MSRRRLLVIPPHADHTLEAVAPEGFEVLDLPRAFAARVLRPAFLESQRSVVLRAAARVLERGGLHAQRAAGAVFAELSAPPSAVGLTLDDIELRPGTTERSADAAAAAARPGAPYEPELEAAVEAARGAEVVRVELERDQQLPAAIALLGRLERAELTGRFATEHRDALRAELVDGRVERRIGELWWRSLGDPVPRGPWAGYVSVEELRDPDRLSGCRKAIVPFTAMEGDRLVGVSGEAAPATRAFPLVGEWWLGAPGIGEDLLDQSLAPALRAFDWIAGLRRFSFARGTAPATWRGIPVRVRAREPDRDLQRTDAFDADGTLDGPALSAAFERLFTALQAHRPLVPGRTALAYLSEPPSPLRDQGRVALDPDAALVPGEGGGGTFCNLRTGATLPLEPPLAALVGALQAPVPEAAALPMLPEPQRSLVLRTLLAKSLVIRC